MTGITTRARFLCGAMLTAGLVAVTPQAAWASCTLTGTVLNCATSTTTTNTDYPANSGTGTDRGYIDVGAQTTTVGSGVTVDGYGLGLAYSAGGPFTVTNDGTIQVDAGNTPSSLFGGSGALQMATNADPITYSGTGNILNLGTGEGFYGKLFFGGSLNANFGGTVRADNGTAILVDSSGPGAVTINTSGPVTAQNGDGIRVTTTSGNAVITSTGNISASGGGAHGILVQTGTGNIDITAGNVSGSWDGIWASSTGGGTVTITTTGAVSAGGASGIYTSSSGARSITVQGASTVSGNYGLYVADNGGLGVVNNGSIWGGTTAIQYDGAGAVTVTNNGTLGSAANILAVNAPSSSGVSLTNNALGVVNGTLNLGGAGDIFRNYGRWNTNGASNFGGGVDSLTNFAGGIVTVAGGSTFSNLETLSNAGTLTLNGVLNLNGVATTVTNSGTINGTNAAITAATPLTFSNNAGGTATLAITGSAGVDTIGNAGTLNLTAASLGDGNDTLTNSGTLGLNGTYDFGAATDSFTNAAAGIVNLNGATTLSNLETLTNAGRINATNNLAFGGVATAVTNSGTFNLAAARTVTGAGPTTNSGVFSAGAGSSYSGGAFTNTATGTMTTAGAFSLTSSGAFANAGTLNLAPALFTVNSTGFTNSGLINAKGGATGITTSAPLTNSGTISLQDGATNDVLTVTGNYVGSNGQLTMDVGDTTADQLVVTGAVSGSTVIDVTLSGTGRPSNSGLLLVNAGSSSAGAFTLGTISGVTSPLMAYSLDQRAEDYYLASTVNADGMKPLTLTRVAGDMWQQSANEVFAQLDQPTAAGATGADLWGQVYVSKEMSGEADAQPSISGSAVVNNRLTNHRAGIQMGIGSLVGSSGRFGITAGWERNKATGDTAFTAKGWNAGFYAKYGSATGFHAYALAKHDSHKIDFDDALFTGNQVKARSNGADGNIGYRWAMSGNGSVDLNAGFSLVRTKIDSVMLYGVDYDYQDMTSNRARLQARYDFGMPWNPYVALTGHHEFKNDGRVAISDGISSYDLASRGKGSWGRLEAGIGGDGTQLGPIVALWGELGDVKGFGARIGFRFGGHAAAMPETR